jgi:hypothetical protein
MSSEGGRVKLKVSKVPKVPKMPKVKRQRPNLKDQELDKRQSF